MDQEGSTRKVSDKEGSDASHAQPSHPSSSGEVRQPLDRQLTAPDAGQGSSSSHLWWWIGGLAIVVLGFFLIHHFSQDTSSSSSKGASDGGGKRGAQQGPAAISVGQITTGNINIYINALGTVTPLSTITLYSQITGKVIAVHYTEGQIVKKGQPLVDIDPQPYEATLAQAEGSLQHDQGVLAEAKIDLARYQAAWARNAIAKQQLDDQEQTVVQDEGTVKSDEGNVQYDKVQLSYCHIVSPINGRVGLRLVDPGNTVFSGSSSTLVVITQLQPITVVFNVSEDDLPQIETQLKGKNQLEVDAFDRSANKQIANGKLTSLDNLIDTTTGTLKFRANFQNSDLNLFPNQFVNARLLVRTLVNVTLAPTAAVQHNGTAAFVYIVNPNHTVGVQPVTVVTSNDQVTAVEGVSSGVTVATSSFDRLENGAQVQVREPGQKKSKGEAGSTGSNGSTGSSGTTGTSGNSVP